MIKRRFFKQDHGDRDRSSDSSSDSSSESDATPPLDEEEEEEEEEREEDDEVEGEGEEEEEIGRAKVEQEPRFPSSGSGYESEDSSVNEVDGDSSGLIHEKDEDPERGGDNSKDSKFSSKVRGADKASNIKRANDSDEPMQAELVSCILKCKSVFKCRLCPRIVCLSEDTVKAHLQSKRHARSKKLLGEGRLKLMLNSDGETEGETHAERHARIVALAQNSQGLDSEKKKDTGRQRQSRRRKKRLHSRTEKGKSKLPTENLAKRMRRTED